jgi:hypothetical protein
MLAVNNKVNRKYHSVNMFLFEMIYLETYVQDFKMKLSFSIENYVWIGILVDKFLSFFKVKHVWHLWLNIKSHFYMFVWLFPIQHYESTSVKTDFMDWMRHYLFLLNFFVSENDWFSYLNIFELIEKSFSRYDIEKMQA